MGERLDDALRVYMTATFMTLDEVCPRLHAWHREHGEDAAIALGLMVATVVAMVVGASA